ncbi:DUF4373 domain-containing protein [Parabacteroides acidifaciens]|uniref:DUF4373 domain-containing protein n=1 Tax=Parabacteroides acidifaciens TaxID=2290935 RepID=A0A3D8HAX0_9BACT|nr:Lin1244/Lin1753 domain-containing protein [Parabacteroides acidifaciens]MBC8603180.1 DUF4373 domain-containing protein [Parabacteroides acidifaciens]RDU48114.1 DUF4373 domain-containing protein [Parabacteroides acidifaciens]
MSKGEAYYFSHDADAMNDPKCMLLISQLGMEGYGAFWGLVELLRVQPEYKMSIQLVPAIAARFQMSEAKLKTVISAFGLFQVTDDYFFYSQSLRDRMQVMLDKIDRRKIASKVANEVRWGKRIALPVSELSDSNPNGLRTDSDFIQNEMKRNEIKKKGIKKKADAFRPPQLSEIEAYCRDRGNNVDSEKFYNFYQSKGWMVGKNKMKDWKAAVRTWEKEDKSKKQQSNEKSKQYTEL